MPGLGYSWLGGGLSFPNEPRKRQATQAAGVELSRSGGARGNPTNADELSACRSAAVRACSLTSEAEQLADHAAIMNHGRLVPEGTPATLTDELGAGTVRVLDFVQRQGQGVCLVDRFVPP